MVPYFPKMISNKGIMLYFIAVAVVGIMYSRFFMPFMFLVFGIAEVLLFFLCSSQYSRAVFYVYMATTTFA